MSKIEVDAVEPQSGTDLTIGASGDTITVPAGATFDSSAATNTLPSTVVTTTGTQTLTNKTINASQLIDDSVTTAKLAYNPNPFRNIIINGDMSIAQRGTSTASITTDGYYTVDRFNFEIGGSSVWTQSQASDAPSGQGFTYSLKMDCTTAQASPASNDIVLVGQSIEGHMLQSIKQGTANAEQTTLSFWHKHTKTGTNIVELLDADNSNAVSGSYTQSVSDTWEKATITFPANTSGTYDNDNARSLRIRFIMSAGSDYTSGTLATTWQTTVTDANRYVGQVNNADSTSNNFIITGVQYEVATVASEFEFLPVDVNLQRCFRYYQKSYDYGTAPGTNTTLGIKTSGGSAGGMTTGYIYDSVELMVQMRTTPTLTFYDKAGNSGVCARLNGGVARTDNQNCTAEGIGDKMFGINSTGTANAGSIDVHFEATAEL